METIDGKNLLVFAGLPGGGGLEWIPVSTSCVLTVTQEAEEVSWRGGAMWRRYRAGWKSWSVTCDGLLPAADCDRWVELLDAGTSVVVALYSVADHPEGVPEGGYVADGNVMRYGYAVVSDYSETGEDGSKATRSLTFTGTGELTTGSLWAGDFSASDFGSDFLL